MNNQLYFKRENITIEQVKKEYRYANQTRLLYRPIEPPTHITLPTIDRLFYISLLPSTVIKEEEQYKRTYTVYHWVDLVELLDVKPKFTKFRKREYINIDLDRIYKDKFVAMTITIDYVIMDIDFYTVDYLLRNLSVDGYSNLVKDRLI